MKIKHIIPVLIALAIALCALFLHGTAEETVTDASTLYKNKDVDETWSADEAQLLDLNTWTDGSVITVTEKGDYVLSGTLYGQVVVEAPEDAKVRLILNGVTITSSEGPAIY